MLTTTNNNIETRFGKLLEFFSDSLDRISFEIESEKKAKSKKQLAIDTNANSSDFPYSTGGLK
jgi:hypothetical protein